MIKGFGKTVILAAAILLPVAGLRAKDSGRIILGDEQFGEYLPLIEGKRVAIFSNQTGIVGDKVSGSRLHDVMSEYGGCFDPADNCRELQEAAMIPFQEPSTPGGKIEYGQHVVDALLEKGVDVTAIFSPEHGFRGTADAGEHVKSSVDEQTGVEILSLYETGTHLPSAESMDKFDILLVDIQDVGLR